jgi:hypothetical protein
MDGGGANRKADLGPAGRGAATRLYNNSLFALSGAG